MRRAERLLSGAGLAVVVAAVLAGCTTAQRKTTPF